jgi:hypothetical protein
MSVGGFAVTVVASAGRVVRVVAFLSILGFLTIILVGPVVALALSLIALVASLLAAILPFALVGLLVWEGYLLLAGDRRATLANLRARTLGLAHLLVNGARTVCSRTYVLTAGLVGSLKQWLLPAAERVRTVARDRAEGGVVLLRQGTTALRERARSASRVLRTLLMESLGGAAVGALLVYLSYMEGPANELAPLMAIGAAIGAAIGVLTSAIQTAPSAPKS